MSLRRGKAPASDPPAAVEYEENHRDLPHNNHPRERYVGDPDGERDQLVEDRRLKLQAKKIGVMRKERRVEVALDGSEVERIILKPGMVAHHYECKYCESAEERQIAQREIAASRRRSGRMDRIFWHSSGEAGSRRQTVCPDSV